MNFVTLHLFDFLYLLYWIRYVAGKNITRCRSSVCVSIELYYLANNVYSFVLDLIPNLVNRFISVITRHKE